MNGWTVTSEVTHDRGRRDLGAIQVLEVALDLAGAHAARVERDHLVVEAGQTALVFANQHRLEAGFAVTWHGDLDGAVAGQHALAGGAVAVVAALAAGPLLVHVVVELGGHQPVQQRLLQLAQQAVVAHHQGRVATGQQLINQLVANRHNALPPHHSGVSL